MRLIDADALPVRELVDGGVFRIVFYTDIQNAPTVEASAANAVRGVWLKREGSQKTCWWECSNCATMGSPRWKRCPLCEAIMEEQGKGHGNA